MYLSLQLTASLSDLEGFIKTQVRKRYKKSRLAVGFVLKVDAITMSNLILWMWHCCCCSLHCLHEEVVISLSRNIVNDEYLSTIFMCKISVTLNINVAWDLLRLKDGLVQLQ